MNVKMTNDDVIIKCYRVVIFDKMTFEQKKKIVLETDDIFEKNAKKYNIPNPAIVLVRPDGITSITDSNTGVGIKGAGILLGVLTDISVWPTPLYKWTWGWMMTNFDSPVADKTVILSYMSENFPGTKLAINTGMANIASRETEEFLRAVCIKAYGLKWITDFKGVGDDTYIIGMTSLEITALSDSLRSQAEKMNELIERRETDPNILLKHNMDIIRVDDHPRDF